MPKFPPIPRLSIIVPVGSDVSAFEETLVSVLENRPSQCEIIVPHDGRYDDPFNLGDEVRLLVAQDGNLVELVMAGARAARGHLIHVLGDGLRATQDWTDCALEEFEHHDVACVIPIVRLEGHNRIVSAGWSDTKNSLLHPWSAGQIQIAPDLPTSSIGAYLRASFWLRDLFLSLGDAFLFDASNSDESVSETEYVFHQLLKSTGWRSLVASKCDIRSDHAVMIGERPSTERGRRLGAAKRLFETRNSAMTITGLAKAALGCVRRRGECGQCFGRATSGRLVASLEKRLYPDIVRSCDPKQNASVTPTPETRPMPRAA